MRVFDRWDKMWIHASLTEALQWLQWSSYTSLINLRSPRNIAQTNDLVYLTEGDFICSASMHVSFVCILCKSCSSDLVISPAGHWNGPSCSSCSQFEPISAQSKPSITAPAASAASALFFIAMRFFLQPKNYLQWHYNQVLFALSKF